MSNQLVFESVLACLYWPILSLLFRVSCIVMYAIAHGELPHCSELLFASTWAQCNLVD